MAEHEGVSKHGRVFWDESRLTVVVEAKMERIGSEKTASRGL